MRGAGRADMFGTAVPAVDGPWGASSSRAVEGPRNDSEHGLGLPPPPPPVPVVAWPERPQEPPAYRPVRRRARWAVGLLVLSLLTDLLAVVFGVSERGVLTRMADGELVPPGEVSASDDRQLGIAFAQGVVFVATAVAFLAWFVRAYANLEALGARDLRYGRRWSVGAWFVPILNLFRPKQIANDIWRGSDPDAPGSTVVGRGHVPGLFALWWAAFLVSGALYQGASRAEMAAVGTDALLAANGLWLAADLVSALSAPLAIAVVLRTAARQELRAAGLGLAPQELPTPLLRRGTTWATAGAAILAVALQVGLVGLLSWVESLPEDSSALSSPPAAGGSSVGSSGVLVRDSFDDPSSGWLEDSGSDFSMGYEGGEYTIESQWEGTYHSYVELARPVAGVRMEVDARLAAGRAIDGYGVACWARDDAGYFASVYADRYYQLVKDPPGADESKNEFLAQGRAARRAIGKLAGETALELTCAGTGSDAATVTLTANGEKLVDVRDRDPLLHVTGVGLFVSAPSGDATAAFDDLVVEVVE